MKFIFVIGAIASINAIQLEKDKNSKDDPICGSAGCTQYLHPPAKPGYPMDYFVPNFGVDHDIIHTENSAKQAEKQLGHNWTPTKNPDGTWNVPTADLNQKKK